MESEQDRLSQLAVHLHEREAAAQRLGEQLSADLSLAQVHVLRAWGGVGVSGRVMFWAVLRNGVHRHRCGAPPQLLSRTFSAM
eukprot:364015-Chlamydomonas_euryale.AAC.6